MYITVETPDGRFIVAEKIAIESGQLEMTPDYRQVYVFDNNLPASQLRDKLIMADKYKASQGTVGGGA